MCAAFVYKRYIIRKYALAHCTRTCKFIIISLLTSTQLYNARVLLSQLRARSVFRRPVEKSNATHANGIPFDRSRKYFYQIITGRIFSRTD